MCEGSRARIALRVACDRGACHDEMMNSGTKELEEVMDRLRMDHDVLPFLTQLHPARTMHLLPLPTEMRAIIERSRDYQSPAPGTGPVWLQIDSDDDAAEMVIYRSLSGELHVVVPIKEN